MTKNKNVPSSFHCSKTAFCNFVFTCGTQGQVMVRVVVVVVVLILHEHILTLNDLSNTFWRCTHCISVKKLAYLLESKRRTPEKKSKMRISMNIETEALNLVRVFLSRRDVL